MHHIKSFIVRILGVTGAPNIDKTELGSVEGIFDLDPAARHVQMLLHYHPSSTEPRRKGILPRFSRTEIAPSEATMNRNHQKPLCGLGGVR